MEEPESGFVIEPDVTALPGNHITDIEILRVSQINVVARGRRHGRLWLLKGLSPELRNSTAGRHRLMKEFEVHARLCHHSIAQVIGVEDIEELGPCIVMEWVEGTVLSDLLREDKLSKPERRRIMHDIVSAADYMHRNGVVHRDLKPSNIIVRSNGNGIAIIDFGLADTDSHTELKQPAGTQGFISPEQLKNGGADPADDVYSIGVIMAKLCPEYKHLARLCTGQLNNRPHDAGALLNIMTRRRKQKRLLTLASVTMAVLLAAAFGAWKIYELDRTARVAIGRVDNLLLENKRNAEYVNILSDWLGNVRSQLIDASTQLKQTKAYNQLYDKMLGIGRSTIDDFFVSLTPSASTFAGDSLQDNLALIKVAQQVDEALPQTLQRISTQARNEGLKSSDIERLNSDLRNYFISKWEKWITR